VISRLAIQGMLLGCKLVDVNAQAQMTSNTSHRKNDS